MKEKLMFFLTFFIISSCVDKKNKLEDIKKNIKQELTIINVPTKKSIGNIVNLDQGCGFNYDLERSDIKLTYPNQREINEIENILSYSGIPMNFEIYSANIDNAVATIIDNKRYIIYDPNLFNSVDNDSYSYWNSMSILAHEIGHHLSGHTMKNDLNSHKRELEADKFSGFILYKMGATLENATNTISKLGTENDSETHPSKYKRITAITVGWNAASGQNGKSAIPPTNDFNDEIIGIEYTLEDFFTEEEIIEYKLEENQLGPLTGFIISINYEDSYPISINVELTKILKSQHNLPFGFDVNKRVEIFLNKPVNAPNATRGYFDYIIKPGNKIQFKIHLEGNRGYPYIQYLKALPRS